MQPAHVYEVRPRNDRRGFDLISDVLPFGRLWYDTPDNAIGYAMHYSRSHDAVIRVYGHALASLEEAALGYAKIVRQRLLGIRPRWDVRSNIGSGWDAAFGVFRRLQIANLHLNDFFL
jgi:hypothetical protein